MANRHIKTINGRKYYYESIRRGKKVTSRYLGPVERIRKRKKTANDAIAEAPDQQEQQEEQVQEEGSDNYIG